MSFKEYKPAKRDWLVMLYIAADDIEADGTAADSIYDECDKMLGNLGRMPHNNNIHLVALFDARQGATSCAHIKVKLAEIDDYLCDVTEEVIAQKGALAERFHGREGQREVDSGSRETLGAFISWAMGKFPATYTMLSVIGHGCGWSTSVNNAAKGIGDTSGSPSRLGLCPDLTTKNAISTVDLGKALDFGLANGRRQEPGRKLNVLFLDACFMAMFEVLYEVSPHVEFVVAGQDFLYAGLPYDSYVYNLNADVEPIDFSKLIVDKYNRDSIVEKRSIRQNAWTIAAIDASAVETLATEIEMLASYLLDVLTSPEAGVKIRAAYDAAQKFNYDMLDKISKEESYVDLFDFVSQLAGQFADIDTDHANGHTTRHSTLALEGEPRVRDTSPVINGVRRVKELIRTPNRMPAVIKDDGKLEPSSNSLVGGGAVLGGEENEPGVVIAARTQSFAARPDYSLANAHGISIYLPPFNTKASSLADYRDVNSLRFAANKPKWGELLARLYNIEASLRPPAQTEVIQEESLPAATRDEKTPAMRNLRLIRQQLL